MLVSFAQPKTQSSRRGIAIMMALVILGIILVVAYIYNFTSRQGKLASRRMFWGETVYFIADSVMEETFHNIKKNPQDLFAKIVDKQEEWLPLDFDFNSIKLDIALGMNLKKSMIKVAARVFDLKKDLEFKGEIVGAIEIVVTVSIKKGIGIPLIRQVSARRGFRYVKAFGRHLHQDYALLLKKKPKSPPPTYQFNRLTIERDNDLDSLFGRVFLGNERKVILGTNHLSQADTRYLDESGVLLNQEIIFDDADDFDKDKQSYFLLDILRKDPAIKPLRNNQTRPDALKWVKDFFRRGAGEDRIFMRIDSYTPSLQSIPITLETVPGKSFRVEGDVDRELYVSVTTKYQTLDNDIDQSKNDDFTVRHLTPQAAMFESDPFSSTTWSLFQGKQDFIQKGKEKEHLRDFIPYRKSSAYAQIFPEMQSLAWSEVKKRLMIQLDQNTQILNIDGIVGVVADKVIFDKNTIIKGQGVLIVMGKIIIQNEIKKQSSFDKLVLVSRATGPALGHGHIHINTDQRIEAYLMCHAFVKNGSNAKITSTNKSFNLKGGMSMDVLDFANFGDENTLIYDPNFSQSDALTLTIGVPIHYYKIYNNEKIDHTSMVDES